MSDNDQNDQEIRPAGEKLQKVLARLGLASRREIETWITEGRVKVNGAAATLGQSLDKMGYHPYTYAVFGAMADKDIDGVLKPLLNTVDYWYCTDLPTPRAASASDLAKRLRAFNKEALVFMDPGAAYQAALDKAGEGDRILVFGSFYTVSGVMAYRNNQAH